MSQANQMLIDSNREKAIKKFLLKQISVGLAKRFSEGSALEYEANIKNGEY